MRANRRATSTIYNVIIYGVPTPSISMTIAPTYVLCQGSPLSFKQGDILASNGKVVWTASNAGGIVGNFSSSNSVNTIYSPDPAEVGTTTLVITATNAFCTASPASLSFVVDYRQQPSAKIIPGFTGTLVCANSPVKFTADGTFTVSYPHFKWVVTRPY